MSADVPGATQLVVDAWVVLVAAASIVVTVLATVLTTTFHLAGRIDQQGALLGGRIDHQGAELGGRIDHQSDEIVLVRERVARLEALFGGRGRASDPDADPPAASA